MNIIVDKNTLRVSGIDRLPFPNEFLVSNAIDQQKDIQVLAQIPKVDSEGNTLYALPQPDLEHPVPTPKTVETTESTKEDGTPNTPIMETKTKQIPILDASGKQVQYFQTFHSYEQQETGRDEDDNPIYKEVEIVETSTTPTLCWATEEYEEPKVDGDGNPLFTTEIIEDVITYEPQPDLEINSDHELWVEDLEIVLIDSEETKIVSLSQSPDHFTYEEVEPSLSTLKSIRLGELYETYLKEKNGQVVSSLLGPDGLNVVFPYGEKNQNDYRSIGITFALDETQTDSIIGSDSHGKFYITRDEFLTLTKEFQDHEINLYMKMKQKEVDLLSDTCNTVDLVKGVVWQ